VSPRSASATAHELARVGLLNELPGETLTKLASEMDREYVPAGEGVVLEGERGDRFYVVLAGLLSVSQDARGERRLLRPGDYFGEVALVMDVPRTASVRAVMPTTVASCGPDVFDRYIRPLFADDAPPS
jgi:cAMP-dependent protein kinase regulator